MEHYKKGEATKDAVVQFVREKGFPCMMGSNYCSSYLARHSDSCPGCESESGCRRAYKIGLILLAYQTFPLKSNGVEDTVNDLIKGIIDEKDEERKDDAQV